MTRGSDHIDYSLSQMAYVFDNNMLAIFFTMHETVIKTIDNQFSPPI